MATHKFNTFHWHLTEDQGWRIEIKRYPKLTEIGAFRDQTVVGHNSTRPREYDGKRYGGYYTQDEIRDVIEFARSRFVTIVPEIELPGHAQAAIAAYPGLGCTGKAIGVMTEWGVSKNVLCPTEETFEFLENVIDEVCALFPGPYLHIGGDECPKDQWKNSAYCQNLIKQEGLADEFELQSYFIKRVEQMVQSRGKRIIGWDEILEGGLAPDATVMSWRGINGGIEAAEQGHDVIMTPTSSCYFDYYNSLHPDEPLAIGGHLPIDVVYQFNPVPPSLDATHAHHVLGGQANLWTEYIPNIDHLLYMAYPRAAAMSEAVWSQAGNKDFGDFSRRLTLQFERYEHLGVDAAPAFFDTRFRVERKDKAITLALETSSPDCEIRYTLDGSAPGDPAGKYELPIDVRETITVQAAAFLDGNQIGRTCEQRILLHKAVGQKLELFSEPSEHYSKGGTDVLINGIPANRQSFRGDDEWLGFAGKDLELIIDLGSKETLSGVRTEFFEDKGAWIHLPASVTISTSTDGKDYEYAGSSKTFNQSSRYAYTNIDVSRKVRYVKLTAQRHGIIENGLPGEGHEAWLFVGEIEVY